MTRTRIIVRAMLRGVRSLSWSALLAVAIYVIADLENRSKRDGGVGLAAIEMSLTELFAVFCCAVAVDRGLSLAEEGGWKDPD